MTTSSRRPTSASSKTGEIGRPLRHQHGLKSSSPRSARGVLNFTEPYYYTPAPMAAVEDIGITTPGRVGRQESVCRRGDDLLRVAGPARGSRRWLGARRSPCRSQALTKKPTRTRPVGQVRPATRMAGWASTTVQEAIDAGPRSSRSANPALRAARGGHRQGGAAPCRAAGGARPHRQGDAHRRHARRAQQAVVQRPDLTTKQ